MQVTGEATGVQSNRPGATELVSGGARTQGSDLPAPRDKLPPRPRVLPTQGSELAHPGGLLRQVWQDSMNLAHEA